MNQDLNLSKEEFRKMCGAFYAAAHNDFSLYETLPDHLKKTEAGQKIAALNTDNSAEARNRVGIYLTGSEQWYTYIGRM